MLTAELMRGEAVVLPYFVQIWLSSNHHTWRLAIYKVLLPNTIIQLDHEADLLRISVFGNKVRHMISTYLIRFGAVLKRARVVDVVHQTDHITGKVCLWHEVKIWHQLVELLVPDKTGNGESWRSCEDRQVNNQYRANDTTNAVYDSYQQVLLLTINVCRADGIQGLVVFSNPPLSLFQKLHKYWHEFNFSNYGKNWANIFPVANPDCDYQGCHTSLSTVYTSDKSIT